MNLDQSRAPGPEHLQYTDMVTNTDDISLRCDDHVTSDDTSNGDNHNNNTDDDSQKLEKEENLTFALILSGKCNSTQTMYLFTHSL